MNGDVFHRTMMRESSQTSLHVAFAFMRPFIWEQTLSWFLGWIYGRPLRWHSRSQFYPIWSEKPGWTPPPATQWLGWLKVYCKAVCKSSQPHSAGLYNSVLFICCWLYLGTSCLNDIAAVACCQLQDMVSVYLVHRELLETTWIPGSPHVLNWCTGPSLSSKIQQTYRRKNHNKAPPLHLEAHAFLTNLFNPDTSEGTKKGGRVVY